MSNKSLQRNILSADYSNFFHCIIFHAKYKILQILTTVLVFTLFLPDSSETEELIWPIDYYKIISSTFGEPRSGRFHYGVDFKSGGITGKKVYTIGDGYISRIRTSPFGYGKALYIKLDSGKTALYGHLSKYLPEIEDRLFLLRIQQQSYDVDWWPESDEFRVKKGQVIAYSGDTGSGAPHLHLEIRDENNQPLNPMNQGLNVHDTIPPYINSVVLIPLDNKSTVNGLPVAQWHDLSSPDTTPFYLSGRIGVAVSTWDSINDSKNILAVYQISLAVDSTIVFSKHYDKLSYSFNVFENLDYLSGKFYGGNGSLSALFRRTGNLVNFYENNGILTDNNPESITHHNLTINARDYSNNQVNCTLPIAFGERPAFLYCGYNGDSEIRIAGRHDSGILNHLEFWNQKDDSEWELEQIYTVAGKQIDINVEAPRSQSKYRFILVAQDSTKSLPATLKFQPENNSVDNSTELNISTFILHDRIVVRVNSNYLLASIPTVQVENNGIMGYHILCPVPEGETSWITSIALPQSVENHMLIKAFAYDRSLKQVWNKYAIDFTVLRASSNNSIHSPDSLLTLHVPPGALYRSTPAMVQIESAESSNGLKKVSKGYLVTLGDEPLRDSFLANLTVESNPTEKTALFIKNGNENTNNNNKWHFVSNERKGRTFTGNINNTGCLAVFEDIKPPTVIPALPEPGSTVTSRRPLLRAKVRDNGSGIEGSHSIVMSIDNIPIYGEYDYEAHHVSYRLHDPLRIGTHTVKVTVTDRVDNSNTREWKFRITE